MAFIVIFPHLPFLSTISLRLNRLERKDWTIQGVKEAVINKLLQDLNKESSAIWLTFLNQIIDVVQDQPKDPELETLVIRQGLVTIVQR